MTTNKSACCGAEAEASERIFEFSCVACGKSCDVIAPALRDSKEILKLVKKELKIQQETHIKSSLDYRNGWRDGIEGFCEALIQFIEGKK